MNSASSMLLIGIGGAGCAMARRINRAFGEGLRFLMTDTDAAGGQGEGEFLLIGGDRLSGRGAGGDIVAARLAAEDSITGLDHYIEGVRLAVIVTALGGGTGGGVTIQPVAFLVLKGESVRMIQLADKNNVAERVANMVPDAIDTFSSLLNKKKSADNVTVENAEPATIETAEEAPVQE